MQFSLTVFGMLLKAFAEHDIMCHTLHVFGKMARLNKALNLQPCNSLLAKMIHIGEEGIALMDFEHIVQMGIVLGVYMISVTLLKNHIRMRDS